MERGSGRPGLLELCLSSQKLPRWVVSAPRRADNPHLPDGKQTLPFPKGWDTSCNPARNGVTQLPASDPLFQLLPSALEKLPGSPGGAWSCGPPHKECEEKIRVLARESHVLVSDI